ncbi:hypothetical protein PHBOTO_000265 [Pseudozyma hubeiensis]|nr:hypothetical protein PHBOTO_000265 [Pseudozyma hubeiensis]
MPTVTVNAERCHMTHPFKPTLADSACYPTKGTKEGSLCRARTAKKILARLFSIRMAGFADSAQHACVAVVAVSEDFPHRSHSRQMPTYQAVLS